MNKGTALGVIAVVLSIVAVVISIFAARPRPVSSNTIVAGAFRLIDDRGRTRGLWHIHLGEPEFLLFDANECSLVTIAVDAEGSLLAMDAPKTSMCPVVLETDQRGGSLRLWDPQGAKLRIITPEKITTNPP